MFPINYTVDLMLYYNFKGCRDTCIPAKLYCHENEYKICFNTENELSDKISFDSATFYRQKAKKVFSVKSAYIGEQQVKLVFRDALISHIKTASNVPGIVTNWTFVITEYEIRLDKKSDKELFRWYLTESHNVISQNMMYFASGNSSMNLRKPHVLTINNRLVRIEFDHQLNCSFIETNVHNDLSISELVKLVSFYYGVEIDFWLFEEINDNSCHYTYKSVLNQQIEQIDMSPWHLYRIVGFSKFGLSDFLAKSFAKLSELPNRVKDILFKSIISFTAIRNDSAVNKFIRLISILISLDENLHSTKKKDGVDCVKNLFNIFGIDFERIDDDNNRLVDMRFSKTRNTSSSASNIQHTENNNGEEYISNFVELRHEVMHALPSEDVISYLKESMLLTRLEISVFVVLLGELGFTNLEYIYHYPQLNILKKK